MKEFRIDEINILKLDVEGAEAKNFSDNTYPWIEKVKILIIEFHEKIRNNCKDIFYNAIDRNNWIE